jgi:hypothetical protein
MWEYLKQCDRLLMFRGTGLAMDAEGIKPPKNRKNISAIEQLYY